MSVTSIELNLREKFKSYEYRCAFFETKLADEVAHDLRRIREAHDMRQADLADKSGMKQAAISRIERSHSANWNIKTLLRLALALDCRLKVTFQPLNEAINELWPEKDKGAIPDFAKPQELQSHSAPATGSVFALVTAGSVPIGALTQNQQRSGGGLLDRQNRGIGYGICHS